MAAIGAVLISCAALASQPVSELRKAILMVYYGTSDDSVRAVGIDAMTERVREAFPQYEVREAFTSKGAIGALKRRTGTEKPTPWEALLRLRQDGFNSIIVANGDLLAGIDTQLLEQDIRDLYPRFFEIKSTSPLLYTADDCRRVLDILLKKVAPAADEQVVFVGHGRDGAANDVYCLVDYILQQEGHANCHVGTVSGYPSLDNVKRILRQTGTRKVVLAPLIMLAAGHAVRDIYTTWREALEGEGYEVRLVKSGVREYTEIQQLVVDKIKAADAEP